MGQRPDADEVDARLRDRANILERDPPIASSSARPAMIDRGAQLGRPHVVEQRFPAPRPHGGGHLDERSRTPPRRPRRAGRLSGRRRLPHPARERRVVLLDEDRVVQPGRGGSCRRPRGPPPSRARAGPAWSCGVEDPRTRCPPRPHVARRQRRDAREPAEEVQRHPLAGQDRRRRAPSISATGPLAPLALGADARCQRELRVDALRTPRAPPRSPPTRPAPSARCGLAPVAPAGPPPAS